MNIPKKDFIQILNGDKNTIEKYKNKVIPQKKCAYCGTEFIPSNRSDEIYCKKCRDIPYDVKSLSNGDLRRREYKKCTQE